MTYKLVLLLFIFIIDLSLISKSCDCNMYPIEKYIDTSENIILVKVNKLINPNSAAKSSKAIVQLLKVYKGGVKKKQKIEFESDNSNCSFVFKQSGIYFLFCFLRNNKYYVYQCSYSDDKKYSLNNIKRVKRYLKHKTNTS